MSEAKPVYSGWVFTDAVALVACPRCGAGAGLTCWMPSRRKVHVPHGERVGALKKKHPDAFKVASRPNANESPRG